MDQTQFFKASLMTLKVQQRRSNTGDADVEKSRILPKKSLSKVGGSSNSGAVNNNGERDEFARQAKEVCQKITTLRNVLLENRCAYMHIGQHLKNATHMTDEQRDLIDRESEKFVVYYMQHLAQMRSDWKRVKRKTQQQQHIDGVLDLLESYLRNVQKIFVEQKKYRVQYELETYRLLKLAADKSRIPVRPVGATHCSKRQSKLSAKENSRGNSDCESDMSGSVSTATSETDISESWHVEHEMKAVRSSSPQTTTEGAETFGTVNGDGTLSTLAGSNAETKMHSSQKVALDEEIQKSQQQANEEEQANQDLSPDEVQMYEQENVQLYHELHGLAEEVELIEKNVVDIAQLQDIFTEKVSMQQQNIERIASAVIGATENVKDANEQIKQAIQRNAGLRVWSLFFLLVMSFALLFLDWYYD